MQERTSLEDRLSVHRPHRARARRPDRHDRARRSREGRGRRHRGRECAEGAAARMSPARARSAAVGRSRRQRHLSRSPCRRRRHREPGLGLDAAAHVHALGRAARLQGRISRRDAGRRSRHQVGDAPDQGPQRLWLAQDRSRRASAGAHLAVTIPTPAGTRRSRRSTSIR